MSESLADTTYHQILRKLLFGDLPPGSRLVNRNLAKELGVSAIPIREALQRLASEGLVEHVPGGGMFTRRMEAAEIDQLYAFREVLEGFAVREACAHIRAFQLDRLDAICTEARAILTAIETDGPARAATDTAATWHALDAAFHEVLIDSAANGWLSRAAKQTHLLHDVIRSKSHDVTLRDARITQDDHEAIVAAIRAGDGGRAAEIMSRHIAQARRQLLGQIQRTA